VVSINKQQAMLHTKVNKMLLCHYWPAVCCPLVSYVAPWSVPDADRRQTTTDARRAKQYCPPTLCVGGPVISK